MTTPTKPNLSDENTIETTMSQLPEFYELSEATDVALFLLGPHGVGKTQSFYEWLNKKQRLMCDRVVSIMDPTADFAMAALDADGDLRFRHNRSFPFQGFESDWLHPSSNKPPAIFFDEFNQGSTSAQNAAMKIVWERHVHGKPLIPGTMITLAGNRLSDMAFVHKTSGPMANRVLWLYIHADLHSFLDYAHSTGKIDPFVVAYLQLNPEHLHISTMNVESLDAQTKTLVSYDGPHPTPRSWENVSKVLAVPDLPESTRLTAIARLVGTSVAINFEQTLRLKNDLPNLDRICATGSDKIPKNASTRLVLVPALLKRVSNKNLGNILTYLDSLPDVEIATIFVRLLVKHQLAMTSNPAYAAWAVKNAHKLA